MKLPRKRNGSAYLLDAVRDRASISKSDFLAALMERGYVHQASDFAALDAKAASGDLVGYIGFDCTAKSLHVASCCRSCCSAACSAAAASRLC